MHSALLVGLLSAKIIGRSLNEAIDCSTDSEKAPGMAATPNTIKIQTTLYTFTVVWREKTIFNFENNRAAKSFLMVFTEKR